MGILIIDGISCSGKSMLLASLQRVAQERAPNFSRLVVSEHLTERALEGRKLGREDVDAHVLEILHIAGRLQSVLSETPFAGRENVLNILIERLFLTFMSRDLMTDRFFAAHADLIRTLALRHVLLLVPDVLIEQRLVRSLEHRSPLWAAHVERLGGVGAVTEQLSAQQRRMLQANEMLPEVITRQVLEISDVATLSDPELVEGLLWPVS